MLLHPAIDKVQTSTLHVFEREELPTVKDLIPATRPSASTHFMEGSSCGRKRKLKTASRRTRGTRHSPLFFLRLIAARNTEDEATGNRRPVRVAVRTGCRASSRAAGPSGRTPDRCSGTNAGNDSRRLRPSSQYLIADDTRSVSASLRTRRTRIRLVRRADGFSCGARTGFISVCPPRGTCDSTLLPSDLADFDRAQSDSLSLLKELSWLSN